MPRSAKRKYRSPEIESAQPKRKIRSCSTCRRLKTRCEITEGQRQPGHELETDKGLTACHRCKILKLECSFVSPGAAASIAEAVESAPEKNASTETPHDCDQRSLDEVKGLLNHVLHSSEEQLNSPMARTKPNVMNETLDSPATSPIIEKNNGPLVADRNSRTAPASLIREMKHYILGAERERQGSDVSDDIVTKGIITEELTHTLLAGFSQLSRRWLFMRSNPAKVRQASPLLFASCVLAGLHINRDLHGSKIHQDIYQHVSSLLSKSMLSSPLPLEDIQSMLIFSMWNLVPNKDSEHLDTWLLSGIAGMQGMLAINFEKLLETRPDGLVDSKSRETLRTWNLICLCHLQFSVGTGRPPILSSQYLDQCDNILRFPTYNSRDQLVAAGVKLYASLCNLVNSDRVQTDSLIWTDIDDWKNSCGQFFELDSTKPLRFAYSCAYLILARRTLKHLSEPDRDQVIGKDFTDLNPILFFKLAVEHAHRILHLFLAMSDLTAFVRPAYENLLCSFAMVTLSEFATYLEDSNATLVLMEKTSHHVQLGGKAEPVSKWALSVLKKYIFDNEKVAEQDRGVHAYLGSEQASDMTADYNMIVSSAPINSQWDVDTVLYQDFPSLEDMFLPN